MKASLKIVTVLLAILLLALPLVSCAPADGDRDIIKSAYDLNDKKYTLTVSPGSAGSVLAEKLMPNANIIYNASDIDGYLAVETGQADAFIYDKLAMEYAIASGRRENLALLPEILSSVDVCIGVGSSSKHLLPSVNEFIKELKDDGTLDDMYRRWIVNADDTMPEIKAPENPDKVIRVATAGLVAPMTYYGDNAELTGLDIELLYRYALFANAEIELSVMGFDPIVFALETGSVDLAFSNLNATDERREKVTFSDPYMTCDTVALIRADRTQNYGEINSLDDLKGKRIGYHMGASYTPIVEERFADSEVVSYNSISELVEALKAGKIDAYFADDPIARANINSTQGLKMVEETLVDDTYGFLLNKNSTELVQKINGVIEKYKADGTMEALRRKWILEGSDDEVVFDESIPTPNGTLNIGGVVDSMPFSYIVNNTLVGYDVELMYMICAELGYKPSISTYQFASLLPAVASGKEDVVIGCITYTEERAETMLFTDSTYKGGPVAVVRTAVAEEKDLFTSVAESFEKTLIRENRWKLILRGLGVTIALSLMSIVAGTLLGFAFSVPLRSKNKFVSGISRTVSMVIDGLPLLVILMILYYVIFAKSTLPAIFVGTIGFTLDFANTVAGMLNTGIKAVDRGQLEAAQSMGYGKFMVFYRITFPQVANQMFGQYSGSIIALIKSTSIIGYITVEDLTKAGDIIRSRTYEAFFPLILTAIIYFIIARAFVFLLSRFAKGLDPKSRVRRIKGVELNDQH